ncbi:MULTISPECIES: hypothetical protein [Alphaproteobacteria]|uniref:hypothetical protein n=1 Tax=Agrobacterium pusense TaxID=648995 RepID=UPI0013006528|nr:MULTISPECIES: hypothetical protein [Alphaproteobacteria]MDH0908573.1 hypothetical protein [Agrobacterium pusense]MDH2192009.1 hypothetical protein [Agrobacterium pusense]
MTGPDKEILSAGEGRGDVILAAVMGRHLSLSARHATAPNGLSNGLIWPKVGFASIAYDATAASNFLPLPAAPSFLARQETPP